MIVLSGPGVGRNDQRDLYSERCLLNKRRRMVKRYLLFLNAKKGCGINLFFSVSDI